MQGGKDNTVRKSFGDAFADGAAQPTHGFPIKKTRLFIFLFLSYSGKKKLIKQKPTKKAKGKRATGVPGISALLSPIFS